jgi:hypothetical protein
MITKIIGAFALTITPLIGNACDAPPIRQVPVPDRVVMVGDSILVQSFGFGGDLRGADVEGKAAPGWESRDVLPRLRADVAGEATSPDVVVIALGHNMADVYGPQEANELTSAAFAPHETACVVFVLPHPVVSPIPVLPESYNANLNRVIADMVTISELRPNTFFVDWSDVATEHPEYIRPDGIHLDAWVDTPLPAPAAVAYLDFIYQGVEMCDTLGGVAHR